jgi:hypothetical protein
MINTQTWKAVVTWKFDLFLRPFTYMLRDFRKYLGCSLIIYHLSQEEANCCSARQWIHRLMQTEGPLPCL